MIDRKSVIPTQEMIDAANQTGTEISKAYEQQVISGDLPQSEIAMAKTNLQQMEGIKMSEMHGGAEEISAAEEMRRRTEEQIAMRKAGHKVEQSLFYEKNSPEVATVTAGHTNQPGNQYSAEKPYGSTKNSGPVTEGITKSNIKPNGPGRQAPPPPPGPPTTQFQSQPMPGSNNLNNTQPQLSYKDEYTGPWDIIELPSKGEIYQHKIGRLKVGFLTAADENILTSPNLLESGQFLEVLLDRKILTPGVRAKDLHSGDRNALMIWLRATGYGEKYPIEVYDQKNDEVIEAEVDLSTLKVKELRETPDNEGLFTFILPKSQKVIKFKLLTVGEEDEVSELAEAQYNAVGSYYSKAASLLLEKQIVEFDGIRDEIEKNKLVNNMLMPDLRAFRKHIDGIESGIDLSISVRTPGGESIDTFLPINRNFFWPEL